MNATEKTHTISVLVENEFGVLARVAGMFAGRGFNIDALSVATSVDSKMSRMTIITNGNEQIIEQILKQLNRLIDVLKVVDVSSEECVRRELMLVKVKAQDKNHAEILKVVEAFSGKILDASDAKALILEFVAEHDEMQSILNMLGEFGIMEVARTGNVAMQKGKNTLLPPTQS